MLAPGGRVIIHTTNVASYAARIVVAGRRVSAGITRPENDPVLDFREEERCISDLLPAPTLTTTLTRSRDRPGFRARRCYWYRRVPFFFFIAPLCAVELAASRLY